MIVKPIVILMMLVLLSCTNSPTIDSKSVESYSNTPLQIDEATTSKTDTLLSSIQFKDSQISSNHKLNKANKRYSFNIKVPPRVYDRRCDLPNDDNWKGKPVIQDIEMVKDILKEFPDTLSKLAIERYKNYTYYVLKSPKDKLEEENSKVLIINPKRLTFRFRLFENEYASSPYIVKDIMIRLNEKEEPYEE